MKKQIQRNHDAGRQGTASENSVENTALSFGEKAVGLSFNPSGNDAVTNCKRAFASIIDNLNALRKTADPQSQLGRYCSTAITQAEIAQMCAVKAITWKD